MLVSEIFDSIQGEGFNMGLPATFIRFAGCNLSCPWCDEDKKQGSPISIPETVSQIRYPLVVITGGEPTTQPEELKKLICELAFQNSVETIAIETNCTADPEYLIELREAANGKLWITGSPKPGVLVSWPKDKWFYDELKLVVDKDFATGDIPAELFQHYKGRVWLQPEASNWERLIWKCYQLAQQLKGYSFRCGVQLHRVMGAQ